MSPAVRYARAEAARVHAKAQARRARQLGQHTAAARWTREAREHARSAHLLSVLIELESRHEAAS